MMNTSRVSCPECMKDYASRRGLKKHLLSAHQLMFVDFTNESRQPTSDELEGAMTMLCHHQRHDQRCLSVPLCVKIPVRPVRREFLSENHALIIIVQAHT